ncbi:MAG: EpsG family protein [Fibrobacter sp.]|nr:EpsG family protein [Fibrobacter sp.]
MFGIEAALYPKIFYGLVLLLCLFVVIKYSASSNNSLLLQKQPVGPMIALGTLLILFIGLRPVSHVFGDTVNYAYIYNHSLNLTHGFNFSSEWLFDSYMFFCKLIGLPISVFFLGIEIGYIGCLVLACRKLLWESSWVAILFCVSAFSFFTYGTNGLRNGLACSIIVLAVTFVAQEKKYVTAAILALLAMGIHRSVMLPIAACCGAVALLNTPKISVGIWSLSIPLSLVAGGRVTNFLASLGFDDRMDSYSVIDLNESFSSMGFRWDFLLYSSMPVLLTWYVHKRVDETGGYKEDDSTALADANSMRVFNILSGTYILANSFWILVINANFSNRFAYLSWFLYPVVLAYGFLRLHIWNDQDRKCAWALLAHAGFTFGMFMIGKL